MLVVAVVGSIGSGKSSICNDIQLQSRFKTKIIDLDVIAKHLRQNNPKLMEDLVKVFGTQVYSASYVMDVIFPSDEKYEQLIEVYTSHLQAYMEAEIAACADKYDVLVFEGAALIHNKQLLNLIDRIVCVNTPPSICLDRVINRGKYTTTQVHWLMTRTNPFQHTSFANWANKGVYYIQSVDEVSRYELINWLGKQVQDTSDAELGLPPESTNEYQLIVNNGQPSISWKATPTAIYPGSVDPFHIGHLAVIKQLLRMYDNVILLRCRNGAKDQSAMHPIDPAKLPQGCKLVDWDKSFVSYLRTYDCDAKIVIARGIRNATDLQYEQDYITHLSDMYSSNYNCELPPVIFVPVDRRFHHISSSSIRAILPFNEEYTKSLIV